MTGFPTSMSIGKKNFSRILIAQKFYYDGYDGFE